MKNTIAMLFIFTFALCANAADVDGNKYSSDAPISSIKEPNNLEQLVQGSEIYIVSKTGGWQGEEYTLSNGHTINSNALAGVRKVADYFPAVRPKIAELLLKFTVDEDAVENRVFIRSNANRSLYMNQAMLYIVVNSRKQWLRMKIQYSGEDWLFVSSYKIAADDYRWQSGKMQFERDHTERVWEWIDKTPNIQELNNLKVLSKAKSPVIRFQGSKYYSDFKLESDQQEAITDIYELFDFMNKARPKR